MKNIIIFCLFFFIMLPSFADDEASLKKNESSETQALEENEEKEVEKKIIDYKYFPGKRTIHKNRLNKSHKMQHYKTMENYQDGHNKNKADFKRRVNVELELLKKEAEILDYHP